jgi:hypothetical protein
MARRRSLEERLGTSAGDSYVLESKAAAGVSIERAELADLRARTAEVLAGMPVDLDTVARALRGLSRVADELRAGMIEVGREVERLRVAAGEGGYRALFRAGLVPFSEATASQLRAVAAAVDSGLIPAERMPRRLLPAYRASRLAPEVAGRLIEAGVLGPETTAREIVAAAQPSRPTHTISAPLTLAERRSLERRAGRLRKELSRIEERLTAGEHITGYPTCD